MDRTGDLPLDGGCLEILGEGIAVAIGVILLLLFVLFVLIPLLVAIVDLVVVILLAIAGFAAKILLRRPWTVEARASDETTITWRIRGWRASGDRARRATELLRSGSIPPADWPTP